MPAKPSRSLVALLAPLALAPAACDARSEAGSGNTARQPECVASGAKHLTPPLSDAAACARFQSRVAVIPGVTIVQLKILPQGVISALVARDGRSGGPKDYGLAVSDRAMTAADLDTLAASVVADLAPRAAQ
jgi:hypothetical protein